MIIAISLHDLGSLASLQGNLQQASEQAQEALALYRELGEKVAITGVLHSAGYLASLQGDWQQADACYREGLLLAREIGDDKQHLV